MAIKFVWLNAIRSNQTRLPYNHCTIVSFPAHIVTHCLTGQSEAKTTNECKITYIHMKSADTRKMF